MDCKRILVIEDDPAIRRGLIDALQFAGYATQEVSEGAAGLAEGVIHYMGHRQTEAVAVLQKVAARFPSLFVARFYLGMALV